MVRKWMLVLVVLAFAASLLTLSSCAKKAVTAEGTGAAPTRVSPPPPPPPAQPPRVDAEQERIAREVKAFEAESIYFDFDKSDLKPAARAVLEKKAGWLRNNAPFKLKIEGNCDERGTVEYNLALGERRAKAAMKYLNALGISNDRMTTVSYGKERPADPGHNETAWAKNRRDDFKLSK